MGDNGQQWANGGRQQWAILGSRGQMAASADYYKGTFKSPWAEMGRFGQQ
jgi:hypothetical protein